MNNAPAVERLRSALSSSGLSPGTFLGLGSSPAIEVAALAGCEWVVLDLEHGGGTLDDVGSSVQAANAAEIGLIVRVPQPERAVVGWVLDQGVAGVMLPRIESLDHAREASSWFDYPPSGQRGVASYTRSAGWGAHSVRDTSRGVCMVQIETTGALEAVGDIAAVPGVDSVFLGPLDLSFALGVPEDVDHKDFIVAMKHFVRGAQKAGIPAGSLISDPARIASMQAYGLDFLALGSDALALRRALTDQVAEVAALGKGRS
ncbi:MAG: aldolase/citrate lyase family protein [Pontimonas sp.]